MAEFDPSTASPVAQGAFDPNSAQMTAPAPEARNALSEIGTGFARGALVDLPTMAGQALQFAGANNVGATVRGFGEDMGKSPSLTLQPESHGGVTNFIASGAQQLPSIGAAALGAGITALAAPEVLGGGMIAGAVGAVPGATLFAGSHAQTELEAAQAKGLSPEDAQAASRLDYASNFATQVGAGMFGGQMLAGATGVLGKLATKEAAPLASQILDGLTGQGGWLMPGLKAAATGAAEVTGIGAVQSGASAAINNAYGIDDQSPLSAAIDSIPQSLSLSGMLGGLGLASRALQARAAAGKTATLADEKTSPALRTKYADEYATAIEQRGGSADAARAFSQNAQTAIDNGMPLKVDAGMFTPGAVQAPVPETPAKPTPLLTNNPSPNIVFPDGTVARSHQEVDDYINGLPENERSEAMARLLGQGPQASDQPAPLGLTNTPTPPTLDQMVANSNGLVKKVDDNYNFPDGSSTKDVNVVQQFLDAQNAPKTPEQLAQEYKATRDSAVQSMLQAAARPESGVSAQDMINQITGVDQDGLTKAQKAKRQADAKAALNEPSGVRVASAEDGIERELSMGELYDLRNQQTAAATPENGIVTPPAEPSGHATISPEAAPALAGSAKAPDQITSDIVAANKTVTGDDTIRQQALKPLQKQLDSLGLDKMGTHQEQIDALDAHLNSDAKIGDATRERMQALLTKWKGETPQEPGTAVGARPAEVEGQGTPEAAAAAAEGIRAMNTANADPDALQATLNANKTMTAGMRARAQTYIDQVREAKAAAPLSEAPAQADTLPQNIGASVESRAPAETNNALPENIPASVQAQSPGADEALPNNLTQSPRSHAQDTADMVDASLASFNQRLRGGEKLTPLEQERYEDLQGFRGTLGEITAKGNHSDDYTQNISEMAREAATAPYKQTFRRYVPENPEATDPSIMREALRTGKLVDTLNSIATNGSTPEVKALADRLAKLDTGTTIKYAAPDGTGTAGEYLPETNHVNIHPGGESEQTILHEATHAAQQSLVSRAEAITSPKTQREAELKKAFNAIESIRQTAIERAGEAQYGLTNAHEFLAELNTNPEFQKFLKSEQVNKQSLWSRAVSAVKSLFGMKTEGDFLSKAMEANEAFFQKPEDAGFPLASGSQPDALFRKSPAEATKVADGQLSKMGGLADKLGDKINIESLSDKAYRALASWKTVQYISDRIRAMPEMVQSGFAKGLDAFQQANESKRIASAFVTKPVSAYADRVQKMLNKLGGDQQRDLARQMSTIGGEASRGGFDYRMNYADNLKAGRDIPAHNKGYVDDIHRQYSQLQRTNPEAAKAIEEGQLLNHKLLVNTTSTIARNLMEIASGSYTKLAADLTRMAPDDAARAAAESRVQGALPAHEMARAHAGKLDIMDKGLEGARNTKPGTFADGPTQALDARLNDMFTAARTLPEGSPLRGHLNELEQMYRAQAQNPYFALGRSGEYFVKASLKGVDEATQAKIQAALKGTNKVVGNLVGNDGNVFFRVNSQDQAKGLHEKLAAAAGTKMVPESNAWGKLAYNDPSFVKGTSPALRQMLADLHSTVENSGIKGEAADAMRETLTRSLLSILPETSSRSAKMSRQGVPGYDADFLGNFSRRAMGGVRDTANIYTQRAFDDSFNQMRSSVEQLNRTGSAQGRIRATDTLDEITKRYANDHAAVDNTTINTINSLGHAFYLALSPAYLIRTTAQPFHRALPLLGSRYGFVNSAKEIGGATGIAMKIVGNTLRSGWQADGMRGVLDAGMQFRNMGLSKSEETFVQELHDRGILNLGQTRQLQQMALGGTQRQQDLQRMASMTAQYAEMTNRLATGLAAFRLAEKGTKNITQEGHAANVEYAIQAVDRAMDNFDSTNTARAIGKHGFAGKSTPLLTAFMNYNLQTMQQIARTVHDGMFNKDKSAEGMQRASEARKEFGGLMATTMMISGAMGLPFANVFAGLYNTYKDVTDPNNPGDIRIDAQNFLANTFGKTAGGALSHGLPHLANFDSSTFGLENLLPGSEFLASRQLLKDRMADQSAALMGPALNGGVGIAQAMGKMADGYWAKGVEASLPSGLKPYFKAYELATKGYTDSKDNPIPLKASGWDVALQAAGFHTGSRATELDAQGFAQAREARLTNRKELIQDRFYKAATSQDPASMAAAQQNLAGFNQANPTEAIRGVAAGIHSKVAALAMGNAFGAGFNVTRQQMPTLAHQIAFARDAAMPGE